MKKFTGADPETKSADIVERNIDRLKKLFPDVFTEGKVDFDALKETLGEYIDDRQEKYSFTWNGKSLARRIAQTPSTGTLRPCPKESVNWDTTQNLFIEGDNLEVLKLLQKSYHKKVKMIYIDPPYNTGGDYIYPDDFRDNIKNYLELTGQKDSEGRTLSTNAETSGRYHTDWLNMMYPRLKLAKNLLRDDGVIFISIDDCEIANLRKLCDEVFDEENFEGSIHWRRRHNQPNDPTKMIGLVAEYIIAYSRNKPFLKQSGVGKLELTGDFSNPDKDPRGDWASKPWKVGSDQSGSRYKITTPTGKVLDEEWMGEESTFESLLKDKRIIWPNGGDGAPRKKYFKFEREAEGQCATNWWPHDRFGDNQGANAEMAELMGAKNVFSNPKPSQLIKNLIALSNAKEHDIILDFFAGACTTFHASLICDLKVHCICVQLPEPLDPNNKDQKAGYDFCVSHDLMPNIAEIGKERMRRVIKKIAEEKAAIAKKEKGKLPGMTSTASALDLGFKVFKLDSSNIKEWDADFDNLEHALLNAVENIKHDRKEADVLYELLLKYGLDLAVPIQKRTISGKDVYIIGAGALIVCLADKIGLDVVEGIAKMKNEFKPEVMRVVFKDAGFKDDVVKTNAVQILRQAEIDDVKSL
jgi:adenine-specific DNA-methyltransferase